jgi:hypothetical protein
MKLTCPLLKRITKTTFHQLTRICCRPRQSSWNFALRWTPLPTRSHTVCLSCSCVSNHPCRAVNSIVTSRLLVIYWINTSRDLQHMLSRSKRTVSPGLTIRLPALVLCAAQFLHVPVIPLHVGPARTPHDLMTSNVTWLTVPFTDHLAKL